MFGCVKVLQASFNLPPQRKPLVSTEAYESVLLVSLSLALLLSRFLPRALFPRLFLSCFSRVRARTLTVARALTFSYFVAYFLFV